MNKKFATLLFAIGLGVAASPALAGQCEYACSIEYKYCTSDGVTPTADCDAQRLECMAAC